MKKVITSGIMVTAILIVIALMGTAFGQTVHPAPVVQQQPASQVLNNILTSANNGGPSLAMYPPGLLDELQAMGDSLYPPTPPANTVAKMTMIKPHGMQPMSLQSSYIQVPNYTIVDLGTLDGSDNSESAAFSINNKGQVVGWSGNLTYIDGNEHGFLWSNGIMTDLGTLGGIQSYAYSINDNGQITGLSFLPSDGMFLTEHAFLYENGSMQDIGLLNGQNNSSRGNCINQTGEIVGTLETNYERQPFLYSNGSLEYLTNLFNDASIPLFIASGINASGQIVGTTGTYETFGVNSHAFLYDGTSVLDLGTLGGNTSEATGINDSGVVVGYSDVTNNSLSQPFVYYGGMMQNLGSLESGDGWGEACGINNAGEIVGWSVVAYVDHAFLYVNGSMQDLNNLIEPESTGWVVLGAYAINDSGQIVGYGLCSSDQYEHAILLNPLPIGSTTAASTVQTSLPPYGIAPERQPGKDSLVLITHGWIPIGDDPNAYTAWVDEMSNSIAQYLIAHNIDNWQVEGYKWTQEAQPFDVDPWRAAQTALVAGQQQGIVLGSQIAAQGWAHVHLIGHSAGAGLIDLVSDQVKALSPSTVIQCTFLDPFVGLDNSGYADYGKLADWSDSYFSRDVETGKYTEGALSNAYNVDVSQLDTSNQVKLGFYVSGGGLEQCYKTESTHIWPVYFYTNTITGNISSDYQEFGWPLSQEAGLFNDAESSYPVGNNPAQILGNPDPPCSQNVVYATAVNTSTYVSEVSQGVLQSITGTIESLPSDAYQLFDPIGSPVWIAIVVTPTNAVNAVSFDAEFTSAEGADGLLSVYWDTNMIGEVDEAAVQSGLQHYTMAIPIASSETSHVLGFHLDPFTDVQSSILLTNIAVDADGVTQSPVLSVVTNTSNSLIVYQLTGQLDNYAIQASTNLLGTNWVNIAIAANTNGTVQFADTNQASYTARFYRAVAQ